MTIDGRGRWQLLSDLRATAAAILVTLSLVLVPRVKAQYRWAHPIRDIRFLLKHPDKKMKAWAERLLDRSRRMFSAWHHRDEMTDAGFHRSMITHRARFLEIVRKPPDSKEATNLTERFQIVELVDGGGYDMSQDY